jgi:outer membrane receptor protein involved in Fe transport
MKNSLTKIFILILLLFSGSLTLAQSGVGKLSGKVIDADTKEALIGANVVLLNTDLGAATDVNGEYFVLNITPGTYQVKFSYVGYAPKTIQNIRIVAGVTYELNTELTTDFSLPEIVVQSNKLFEEKATNTVKVFDAEQISRLPVRGVTNIASLQSGVVSQDGSGGVTGNATLNVRGGRGSEILYIVDGVPQTNLYNRGSASQVSDNAIEQISFQVGGYEAKYGQAQSGIISITTKSGNPYYKIFGEAVSSTYLDKFGYNLYSGNISGPIYPGLSDHTIFLSAERSWTKDGDPPSIPLNFPSINESFDYRPNNPADVWRFTGKTKSLFGSFSAYLSANINLRHYKNWDMRKAKQDSKFNDQFSERNFSYSGRVSQTISASTFWNLTLGYKSFELKRYLPFFGDNLLAYGDSATWKNQLGVYLAGDGLRPALLDAHGNPVYNILGIAENGDTIKQAIQQVTDQYGIFRPYGYATGLYQHRVDDEMTADFDLTSQIGKHLFEIGGGVESHTYRGFFLYPSGLALQADSLTIPQKFAELSPTVYGFDVTGQTKTNSGTSNQFLRPRKPLLGYAYLQDRFELQDLVLNIGLRMDYFDIKSYVLKDPSLPLAGGSDPLHIDPGDFKLRDPEVQLSPRIGLGFPVTESTVFHAQFGRFIQIPDLNYVYAGPYDYVVMYEGSFDPQYGQNGALKPEETLQYEIGFRQMFGNNMAAINLTAFYKNIKDLVNVQNHLWQKRPGGETHTAIYPENADFGTTKGLAFSLDVNRINYFSLSLNYTFSVAEGTGSSTNSSQTAVFRNQDRLAPKVIAPLSFDQRHTATATVDFYVPEGELGIFEMLDANVLVLFNSGRPYTPVDKLNLIGDNTIISNTLGYINSAYGPSSFRVDLRLEKSFYLGGIKFSPYLWIQNVFDADNVVTVYRSTGSPSTTDWLNTAEAQATAQSLGEGYVQDYMSLERDPINYGLPRLIRLGIQVDISNL